MMCICRMILTLSLHVLNKNTYNSMLLNFISRKRVNSLSPPPLELNGTLLDRVSSYKYLGVTLNSDLSWSLHITNCCNRTRRLIGLLYRQFYQNTFPPYLLRDSFDLTWNMHLLSGTRTIGVKLQLWKV